MINELWESWGIGEQNLMFDSGYVIRGVGGGCERCEKGMGRWGCVAWESTLGCMGVSC